MLAKSLPATAVLFADAPAILRAASSISSPRIPNLEPPTIFGGSRFKVVHASLKLSPLGSKTKDLRQSKSTPHPAVCERERERERKK